MARDPVPQRELPTGIRAPIQARLGPSDAVWAVIPGERDDHLVATAREVLHIMGGRVVGSWWLVDLDDIRPVGGARAVLIRRRDGAGGALAFEVRDGRPDAIQAITVLELLIARATKAARNGRIEGLRTPPGSPS
jgi:hypothetical protein